MMTIPAGNRLIHEKSPYLRQHARNPVDWQPWDDQALARAAATQRPILLSIGYATCHWCHVMERESFTDPDTARRMNQDFVCIKVDREERPDLDHIYMSAVQALTGSGGWPLNVFLTPDRRPFFGGTYFPPRPLPGRPSWTQVLAHIAALWQDPSRRKDLLRSADGLTLALERHMTWSPVTSPPDAQLALRARRALAAAFDADRGGSTGAPKFPSPANQAFLFFDHRWAEDGESDRATGTNRCLAMATTTLRAMARGGICDQIGGGFHRYATDADWHVPHFEKMLYDNAQLMDNFLTAHQITGNGDFADVAREIAAYVLREMTHPDGGFYSAQDADSPAAGTDGGHGAEGAFYTWTQAEIDSVLSPADAAVFAFRYGVRPQGNVAADPMGEFAGKNILFQAQTLEETAERFGTEPQNVFRTLENCRSALLDARNRRPAPLRDDKVICSWNGLMISALARASWILDDATLSRAARQAAFFVLENHWSMTENQLYRRWHSGERKVPGTAEDYAFFIQGLLDLFEADFDPAWLERAESLARRMLALFYDPGTGGFFSTRRSHDPGLILRFKEETDSVVPSAASVGALCLLRLDRLLHRPEFAEAARRTIAAAAGRFGDHPASALLMLVAMAVEGTPRVQIRVTGRTEDPAAAKLLAAARRLAPPGAAVFALGDPTLGKSLAKHLPVVDNRTAATGGGPAAHVCIDRACRKPVTDESALAEMLTRV